MFRKASTPRRREKRRKKREEREGLSGSSSQLLEHLVGLTARWSAFVVVLFVLQLWLWRRHSRRSCFVHVGSIHLPFSRFHGIIRVVGLVVSVSRVLSSASVVGFSGSRSVPCSQSAVAIRSAITAVPAGVPVHVGCAAGVDALVRSMRPAAVVFSVAAAGFSGRGAFARRSQMCVQSVAVPGGVWVSFPSGACPESLVPSASTSRCFSGLGSGSWASLAFAAGLGVQCLLFLPPGVEPPTGWGFVPGGGGWFFRPASVAAQLSLF